MIEVLRRLWKFLEGKKTNLTALCMAVATYLMTKGLIGQDEYALVMGVLAALGLYALGDRMSRLMK